MFPAPTKLSDNTGPKSALIKLLEALECNDPGLDRSELQKQCTAFIQAQLESKALHFGPAAEAWLIHDGRGFLLSRLKATAQIHDAIIGAVYDGQNIRENPHCSEQLENEFWSHISTLLRRMAGRGTTGEDSVDLMQSAIASVLSENTHLEFWTQAQFLSYLTRRMSWKLNNQVGRRRDKILMDGQAAANVREHRHGPATRAAEASLHGRARERISRLGDREQYLVQARLDGIPMEERAKNLGLSIDACRKASLRAWKIILSALEEECDS
jgi:DNA-directed RNA polymerase specialized sigma24 family protein